MTDFKQFKTGKQFGGWMGLVPSQNSSGGMAKRGNVYLRTLLVQGAKSAVLTAHERSDHISQWLVQLNDRAGAKIGGCADQQEREHPVVCDDTG